MRNIRFSYIVGLLLGGTTLFWSCSKELELRPENNLLTVEQVREAGNAFADRAAGLEEGLYAEMKVENRIASNHSDFGIASMGLILGQRGDGMFANHRSYDWYRNDLLYRSNVPEQFTPNYVYRTFYAFINQANKLLLNTDATSKDPEIIRYRAEAKAFRAWAYMNLIQLYQFTYDGNQSALGVPIVDENMTLGDQINNPRKTVQEVYDYIEKDLLEAEEAFKTEGMKKTTSNVYINENTVNGFLARMYLLKKDYAKAAEKADAVITKAVDKRPYSIEEASRPNFFDGEDKNVIWASIQTSNDPITRSGILNWQSMMCMLSAQNSYASLAPRMINPDLYAKIPDGDARKNWWVTLLFSSDGDVIGGNIDGLTNYFIHKGQAPAVAEESAINVIGKRVGSVKNAAIKFGFPDDNIDKVENSSDYPLMRIEEMYYIKAEALYLSGKRAEAKVVLETFVKTYRHKAYVVKATTPEAFIDEIYFQRKIEFWGEMLPYYDMMRLKKDMHREGDLVKGEKTAKFAYPKEACFNVEAGSDKLILQFPRREVLQNKALDGNENPLPSIPDKFF
ncbi:MAG: RagB/SusD family nutrient uptake outer membrane protein [Bacteroides sp.]